MTHLIGLAGPKRGGKNTTGAILAEKLAERGQEAHLVGFADKLKIAAARALGFQRTEEELIELMDSFKEGAHISALYQEPGTPVEQNVDNATLHSLTGRQYLQWFGTEAGRQTFSDSFWVDLVLPNPSLLAGWESFTAEEALRAMYPGIDVVVVTDARFPNEAERVLRLNGEVWEVQRPGYGGSDAHASEQPLPRNLVTRVINNDGDLAALEAKVEAALG